MNYWEKLVTPKFLIALLVLFLYGGAISIMSFIVVPEQNKEVVFQLVGGVVALAGMVIGDYFKGNGKDDQNV